MMYPKTHIYPYFYTPYYVLINMYPRDTNIFNIPTGTAAISSRRVSGYSPG